jgi:vacuolar-type H+-ATPase subunit I/STV1
MNEDSFFSRILWRDTGEDQTSGDSAEAFETVRSRKRSAPEEGGQPRDFAVELVVETIDDLPSNFPRESAIRIVQRTLAAAGIEVRDFNRSTWARMPQINSEIERARRRDKEFKEKTEQDIRSLEEEIRKAREDYQTVRAKEEEEISRASKELENLKRVRAFFGFSDMEGDEDVSPGGEAAEARGPLYTDSAQRAGASFTSRPFLYSSRLKGR